MKRIDLQEISREGSLYIDFNIDEFKYFIVSYYKACRFLFDLDFE